MNTVIETHDLTKYYRRQRGIENLNLTVSEGDFFGCIGPNGAGKSTTIRTLLGLITPTSGTALLFGKPVTLGATAQLKDIGYLPAEAAFWSGMRVKDIIRLSASLRGMDCTAEAASLCERLRLDVTKKADDLSLGNRKKVAIVCALQHKPSLYILDEPTSGLDPLMQSEFYALLEERNRAGATIFLSSHVLSEVQRHCRRAAIIRNGSVIACDSVEKLGKTNARRVTLHGAALPDALRGFAADIKENGDGVSFLYHGTPALLLEQLGKLALNDFTVTEPTLDEIFLHYYQNETEGAAQ